MATWTDARPDDSEDLFQALYSVLWTARGSTACQTQLDIAAFYYIKTSSCFSSTDRPLAVAHMAAHLLESSAPDSTSRRAGGPVQSRSNDRGSASFSVPTIGTYFGISHHLLYATEGGRALLAMIVAHPTTTAIAL